MTAMRFLFPTYMYAMPLISLSLKRKKKYAGTCRYGKKFTRVYIFKDNLKPVHASNKATVFRQGILQVTLIVMK